MSFNLVPTQVSWPFTFSDHGFFNNLTPNTWYRERNTALKTEEFLAHRSGMLTYFTCSIKLLHLQYQWNKNIFFRSKCKLKRCQLSNQLPRFKLTWRPLAVLDKERACIFKRINSNSDIQFQTWDWNPWYFGNQLRSKFYFTLLYFYFSFVSIILIVAAITSKQLKMKKQKP